MSKIRRSEWKVTKNRVFGLLNWDTLRVSVVSLLVMED